jgi:hypothetical protein
MSEEQMRDYAESKAFRSQTVERWLGWREADRNALWHLVAELKIGENHLRDFMDWLEEIALRDGTTIHDVLAEKTIARIETDPRLGRTDKLKRIKEALRRRRFPRLAETEDVIRERIRELNLDPDIHMSVPPGLEGGRLEVHFTVSSQTALQRLARKLSDAAERDSVRDIFERLSPRGTV